MARIAFFADKAHRERSGYFFFVCNLSSLPFSATPECSSFDLSCVSPHLQASVPLVTKNALWNPWLAKTLAQGMDSAQALRLRTDQLWNWLPKA
ncbi:hypothetical protein [Microvirga arsenatis]|uniref:Uncharacterized protein n=1 Tax=Microvirga arsenatis TaxID=2692265 RepID=A0ABW9Z4W9_9HYPH|nr:hypothetical protein [Microvirga arsenatis]NBJ11411.1 hypothetical protein [Microvirga arsenatis]NBJ25684.1 hypothetical protein [Microvirga arsenatis]